MVDNTGDSVKDTVRIRLIVRAELPDHDPLQCVLSDVQIPLKTATRAAELSHENFVKVLIAAKKVAKEKPALPPGWPNAGRVVPATGKLRNVLHKAKWPFAYPAVERGRVAAVPVTWLRRAAQLLGLGLADLSKAKIEDD